jgi:IMP cyclohydrolase
MSASLFESRARAHFLELSRNPYPGRGIVAGLDGTGEYLVQVYWIMGRSENSRNRVFKQEEDGRLYTEAADPSKVEDPSLIIYNAMLEAASSYVVSEAVSSYVVSNGEQTDAVISKIHRHFPLPLPLEVALGPYRYEPDDPNFTQRITALSTIATAGTVSVQMSILRKSDFGMGCDRMTYDFNPYPLRGFGFCITTYSGDGEPLPAFRGDPLPMPLPGGPEDILKMYWEALNEENRVSLAVKWIEIGNGRSDIYIINKYKEVGFPDLAHQT